MISIIMIFRVEKKKKTTHEYAISIQLNENKTKTLLQSIYYNLR
jgi:hypothetical protein